VYFRPRKHFPADIPAGGLSRRGFLRALLALSGGMLAGPDAGQANNNEVIQRRIPSSGEALPVIGMGSWLTFDVAGDDAEMAKRVQVLREFFARGGALIDSSPMYGSSEEVIGYCLSRLQNVQQLFSATKVWTPGRRLGINQMKLSQKLWGVPRFDLMQIHNMLDWQTHLHTLRQGKADGRIRYIGITTSHGRRHAELEKVLRRESFDFVQFTYNILDREAEQRLLPLARDRGIAVIVNRPFQRGGLFDRFAHKALPAWAGEFDCRNWAQFFLKFIISHPAVTCAIPATTRVDHMRENMGACYGPLPDARMRRRMSDYVHGL
jgi:diketogulonate reductase-like aldo/keto reductase